jgi:uncharacterized protein (DUF885 family)
LQRKISAKSSENISGNASFLDEKASLKASKMQANFLGNASEKASKMQAVSRLDSGKDFDNSQKLRNDEFECYTPDKVSSIGNHASMLQKGKGSLMAVKFKRFFKKFYLPLIIHFLKLCSCYYQNIKKIQEQNKI